MSAPDRVEAAKRDALRLLEKRSFTRAALVERLRRKGHDEASADAAASVMERLGLIDDGAFARDMIDRELERTPAARALLAQRLASRGVEAGAAEAALDEALAGRDALGDALAAARVMRRKMPENLDAQTALRRLAGRLARRGFDEEVALEAARRTIGASADLDDAD
ncbi:MAG: recombination regulator RecX [Phycisphaerales bacterium]